MGNHYRFDRTVDRSSPDRCLAGNMPFLAGIRRSLRTLRRWRGRRSRRTGCCCWRTYTALPLHSQSGRRGCRLLPSGPAGRCSLDRGRCRRRYQRPRLAHHLVRSRSIPRYRRHRADTFQRFRRRKDHIHNLQSRCRFRSERRPLRNRNWDTVHPERCMWTLLPSCILSRSFRARKAHRKRGSKDSSL